MSSASAIATSIVFGVVVAIVFVVIARIELLIASRSPWYRWKVRPKLTAPFRRYREFWWRVLPDGLFLMWLRAGVLDEDDYRALQEQGFVENDVDPEYIQKLR